MGQLISGWWLTSICVSGGKEKEKEKKKCSDFCIENQKVQVLVQTLSLLSPVDFRESF